jgi:uncharacterized protein YkwD
MRTLLLLLCAAVLALTACVTLETPASKDATPGFVTATLRPTRTPFGGTPTGASTASTPSTPDPNATLAATADPNCKDAAVLLQDVTIADGTNVAYGAKFTKTWQFRNSGSCPWHGYTIAFASGDRMGAPDSAPVSDTAPKSNVNVSVDLAAPTSDGIYTGIFELRNAKGQPVAIGIEKTFWVKIAVGDVTAPTVSAASTAAPTAGTAGTAVTGQTQKAPGSCKYVVSGSYPGEVVDLINRARADAGLPALTVNAQLASAAQAHSIDMACFSLLSHSGSNGSSPQQRVSAAGYSGGSIQEMIYASGYPQDAFDWWMGDATHRNVIMNTSITNIGVGYAYVSDSAYGGYYTVDVGN